MQKIDFGTLPVSPLPAETGSVLRRFTGGEQLTVAQITFAAGSALPGHRHTNEQFTLVLSGTMEFFREDNTTILVNAGEMMHLPSNEWHGARSITDAVVLDMFAPPRADWGPPPPAGDAAD